MSSAERNASNVRVPKKASRMIRNAQASETISSVRATEQFLSVRTSLAVLSGRTVACVRLAAIFAVAERAIRIVAELHNRSLRQGAMCRSCLTLGAYVPINQVPMVYEPD